MGVEGVWEEELVGCAGEWVLELTKVEEQSDGHEFPLRAPGRRSGWTPHLPWAWVSVSYKRTAGGNKSRRVPGGGWGAI